MKKMKLDRSPAKQLFVLYTVLTYLVVVWSLSVSGISVWISQGVQVIIAAALLATRRLSDWKPSHRWYRAVFITSATILFVAALFTVLLNGWTGAWVLILPYILMAVLLSTLYGKMFDMFAFAGLLVVVTIGTIVGYYEKMVFYELGFFF